MRLLESLAVPVWVAPVTAVVAVLALVALLVLLGRQRRQVRRAERNIRTGIPAMAEKPDRSGQRAW